MDGITNLSLILQRFSILREGEKISHHPTLEYLFKNIWADNGDICSIEYSGTGALKTDFTRTGKRTIVGAMQDGYNSGMRYFKNNFIDGYRQVRHSSMVWCFLFTVEHRFNNLICIV